MRTDSSEKTEKNVKDRFSYVKLFWLFMIGSVIGFVLEGIWYMLITQSAWENHSATLWGPFCIVYGIGTVLLYTLSLRLKGKNIIFRVVIYALVGAAIEYFASLFQEICFGSTSWDYSDHFLNFGGRVSLAMTLLWGILGILFEKFIFPIFSHILDKTCGKYWDFACGALTVFMIVNLIVTSAAVLRWKNRLNHVPPTNRWEMFLDDSYDNEAMSEIFPNMVFQEKE